MIRKTSLLLSLTMLLALIQVNAQVHIGARAGYQMTTLKYTGLAELIPLEMKTNDGFEAGIFAEFDMGEHFSIQPAILYSERGFLIKENLVIGLSDLGIEIPGQNIIPIEDIPINVIGRMDLNYLTLPVLAKLKFGNENVKVYFNAGPEVSYALNADLGIKGQLGLPFNFLNIPIPLNTNWFEKFQAGAVFGAGLEFGLEKGKFLVNARYSVGMTDLLKVPVVNANVRNRGLSFNAGYAYSL